MEGHYLEEVWLCEGFLIGYQTVCYISHLPLICSNNIPFSSLPFASYHHTRLRSPLGNPLPLLSTCHNLTKTCLSSLSHSCPVKLPSSTYCNHSLGKETFFELPLGSKHFFRTWPANYSPLGHHWILQIEFC